MPANLIECISTSTIGVGDAPLSRGLVERRGKIIRTFIKQGTYDSEIRGARFLNPHLPVVHPIYVRPNISAFPDLSADGSQSLHHVVENEFIPLTEMYCYVGQFIASHANLWNATPQRYTEELITGYPKKIDSTIHAMNLILDDFTEMSGVSHTTLRSKLGILRELIKQTPSRRGMSKTHGDENWGNAIIRGSLNDAINTRVVHIDYSSAGYRSPYESLAKIIGWTYVADFQNQLTGNTHNVHRWKFARDAAIDHINEMRLVKDDEPSTIFSAHLAMYLMREFAIWSTVRNQAKSRPMLAQVIVDNLDIIY